MERRESSPPKDTPRVSFREALHVWIKVALLSFGGPAGQIAVMHRLIVEERRWIGESRFLHALNYCMMLPGPEAQQLAIYLGWLLHRGLGGLVAGTLFVLPGFIAILLLSILYAGYRDLHFVEAVFYGLKPAVMAVVVVALVRIGRKVLKNAVMLTIAAVAFIAIFLFDVPFPFIIAGAVGIGFIGGRLYPRVFLVLKTAADDDERLASPVTPSWGRLIRVGFGWLAIWFIPLFVLATIFGTSSVYTQEGLFFSKAAVMTFGGAYAVLAYIAQQAVNTYGWLEPGEMLDGLGMAETTPGPLIMVVQFVGFMGAYRNPGPLDPMWAGVLGSVVATWVTFAPCFLWIFLGAPHIEQLRHRPSLTAALSAITAAVVGVILNLALWFSLHTLFEIVETHHVWGMRLRIPVWDTLDIPSLAIGVGALVAMMRFRIGLIKTLAASVTVGILYYWIFQ